MRLPSLRPFAALALASALLASPPSPNAAAQDAAPTTPNLSGFDRAGAERQRATEAKFDAILRRENLREWMKRLSARPHHVGSPYGKENAEFMAGLFRSWGYEVEIERFDVLFPTPKVRLLEMTAPERFAARRDFGADRRAVADLQRLLD
jgi:N-acetylated-alpha-linked acidic dipeptidase